MHSCQKTLMISHNDAATNGWCMPNETQGYYLQLNLLSFPLRFTRNLKYHLQ